MGFNSYFVDFCPFCGMDSGKVMPLQTTARQTLNNNDISYLKSYINQEQLSIASQIKRFADQLPRSSPVSLQYTLILEYLTTLIFNTEVVF